MRQLFIIRFKVRGNGEFPFDMLRYDACSPTTETEARQLGWNYAGASESRGAVEIELESRGRPRFWRPTAARWESFLWRVLEETVEAVPHT